MTKIYLLEEIMSSGTSGFRKAFRTKKDCFKYADSLGEKFKDDCRKQGWYCTCDSGEEVVSFLYYSKIDLVE